MDEHDQAVRPDGPEPYPIADPENVDDHRASLGLPSLEELRTSLSTERVLAPEAARRNQEQELAWRRSVGWIK